MRHMEKSSTNAKHRKLTVGW
jgi:hypothetical protein